MSTKKLPNRVTSLHWTLQPNSAAGLRKSEGGTRFSRAQPVAEDERPHFSVVTISFNSGTRLARCMDAVRRQTFRDFEYILIDGGSEDQSLALITARQAWIDYYVSEPDTGIYNALNKGLSLCNGRYIVVIHADDFLTIDALEHAASAIEYSGCDIALGDSIYIDADSKPIAYKPARDYGSESTLRGIPGPHEAAFISAGAYERCGPYDESYAIAADFKLMRNAALIGMRFFAIGRVVNYKELGGESFDKARERSENARLLREIYPGLSSTSVDALYALKNYVNPTLADYETLTKVVREEGSLPSILLRDLSLALISRLRGDGPTTSTRSAWDRWFDHGPVRQCARRVVLTIFKIKGTAGGAERVLVDLANHLSGRGYDVWIACTDGRATHPFYGFAKGVRFVDLNEQPNNNRFTVPIKTLQDELKCIVRQADSILIDIATSPLDLRTTFSSWSAFSERMSNSKPGKDAKEEVLASIPAWVTRHGGNVTRWRAFLNEIKPDIVLPFMISNIQQVHVALGASGPKVFLSNHNNSIRDYYQQDEWDDTPIDRLLRFSAIRAASKSHWLLEEYVQYLPPVCRQNAVVIGNAVYPAEEDQRATGKNPTILAVGRLTIIKNFSLLVEAFQKLASIHPTWIVKVFGEGPERAKLEALIESCKLQGRVKLMGVTESIAAEYADASIFVSTSTVEGFPLTLCEAMAHELPVIGRAKCSGVNSIIEHGTSGLLMDAPTRQDEAAALAHLLDDLIRHPLKRSAYGIAARRRVEVHRSELVFGRWESEIAQLLDSQE